MIKVIPPDSWDFGVEPMQLVKASTHGLRNNDLKEFVKRAGHELSQFVRTMNKLPGEELVHLIAMGATESSGSNRNGDGWKSANLMRDHPTFEKSARAFRNHQNKDRSKSYGIVKKSWWNDEMKRVELIVAYNATKEAADRNGGLVADEEIEKLAKDDTWPVSMSAKVPFDSCSGCGNKAHNRSEYCDGAMCKYGGLKRNIGKVFEDGHHLHADNPESTFFDISKVHRGADRTAFVLGKVAADNSKVVSGAELAEILGVGCPIDLWDEQDKNVLSRIKIACDLAEIKLSDNSDWDRAFDPKVYGGIDGIEKHAINQTAAIAALTKAKVLLPISAWLHLSSGSPVSKCAAAAAVIRAALPAAAASLREDDELPKLIRMTTIHDVKVPAEISEWASKQADAAALNYNSSRKRVRLSVMRNPEFVSQTYKSADVAGDATSVRLGRCYLAYQANFLAKHANDPEIGLMRELVLRHNRSSVAVG